MAGCSATWCKQPEAAGSVRTKLQSIDRLQRANAHHPPACRLRPWAMYISVCLLLSFSNVAIRSEMAS